MIRGGAATGEDAMLENPEVRGRRKPPRTDHELGPVAAHDPPLDLVHLSRQCQGDPDLEDELLGLFRLQSRASGRATRRPSRRRPELSAKIAHKLRGSALAVGAGRVARAARGDRGERAGGAGSEAPRTAEAAMAQAVAALAAAVAEAVAEIERLRG